MYQRKYSDGFYLKCAQVYLETKGTVRTVAQVMGCSKSAVHHAFKKFLPELDISVSHEVEHQLSENKKLGQMRGGESTKKKYSEIKKQLEKSSYLHLNLE